MFILYADKNRLTVRQREPVTSGSVNVYEVQFLFSPDWEGMTRTAVFCSGGEPVSVLLDDSGRCIIPWEALVSHGRQLTAGVYGTREGDVMLPTVWAGLGTVLKGAASGADARPPAPELWRQELARKQDRLTGRPGQIIGIDESGAAAAQDLLPGSGGGGADYRLGYGLKVTDGLISVNAVSDFDGDNTLPMTAAGVQASIGNIETLLGTI